MEYATGMLLAETAFENYDGLSNDFPAGRRRCGEARRRPGADPSLRPMAPLLDEM